jgi:hypothetical protein
MASPSVASRIFLLLALLWFNVAWAAPAAVVTHLSGTLSVLKADGTSRILSQLSEVESGDTLTTQKDSFVRLKFSDGGELTLRPNSVFKLDNYVYQEAEPQKDSFLTSLLKGGLRTITGLVGKRGNRDAYRMNTATATIGIRGTYYVVLTCKDDCPSGMKNGTYTKVLEGIISLKNKYGEIECSAGQTCYSSEDAAPVVLTEDPGVDFETPLSMDAEIEGDTLLDPEGHRECRIR